MIPGLLAQCPVVVERLLLVGAKPKYRLILLKLVITCIVDTIIQEVNVNFSRFSKSQQRLSILSRAAIFSFSENFTTYFILL